MRRRCGLRYMYDLLDDRLAVEMSFPFRAELHDAVFQCGNGMIFRGRRILPGQDAGAALADDDIPRAGKLPGVELHAEVFRIGIP